MELMEIQKILKKGNIVIFGPCGQEIVKKGDYRGLVHIEADQRQKTIRFTSDTTEYLMHRRLEEVLELLFKEFEATSFHVEIHRHKGDYHDKDVILKLDSVEEFPEIIRFIQDRFYKPTGWNFAAKT